MVFGNIENSERYYALHPDFKEIFEFLRGLSEENLSDGISNENFTINVQKSFIATSDTKKDGTEKLSEAHRKYMDIHYCISGSEGFGFCDIALLDTVTEYNESADASMHSGKMNKLIMHKGDFCIVYPEDAHTPLLNGDSECGVLKAIVKVKVNA
ncbi:MAG: DUF386 domain-containing protein [Ruminococcaceae bacterium]|nr:DUF386 domain-containing protein [Oscillospiraceae bacterium]